MSAYTPHTPADIAAMLQRIGAPSLDALVAHVPSALRGSAGIDLPPGLTEPALRRAMERLAARNGAIGDGATFLGAGAYAHRSPAVVNQVLLRSEFATAYTPYQPEVSQGTLQAIFEFQTFTALLMGLDVANASMYDGASATAEAVLMARRLRPDRSEVLVSRALHPEYRATIATYVQGLPDVTLREVPLADGRTDDTALKRLTGPQTLCVVLGYPNVLGVIEDVTRLATIAHEAGALVISATPEPLALGYLRSPGACGADIAVAEGQGLGLPVSYGGPGVGLFAARDAHVRAMPGRIVGETVDAHRRRGYVLTLATREQHIRRQRATSNICTNQGLCALAVTVYLSALGRDGLRRVAEANYLRAHAVAERLGAVSAASAIRAPFFNEFLVRAPEVVHTWDGIAEREGIVPGFPIGRWLPEYADHLLVCVTEVHDDAAIDRLVEVIGATSGRARARGGQ